MYQHLLFQSLLPLFAMVHGTPVAVAHPNELRTAAPIHEVDVSAPGRDMSLKPRDCTEHNLVINVYHGEGCTDYNGQITTQWSLCGADTTTPYLPNYFQSMKYVGGTFPANVYACQQGYSCTDAGIFQVSAIKDQCTTTGGSTAGLHFDKLYIIPSAIGPEA